MEFFLWVLGMVMVIEGLPYFAFPEQMKSWIARIGEMPAGGLRRCGLSMLLLGHILDSLGRT